MIFPGSRYQATATYTMTRPDGTLVAVLRPPLPGSTPLQGFFKARPVSHRLDLVANHFLHDPTAFWQLCDANNAVVPDALATQDLIGIPATGR